MLNFGYSNGGFKAVNFLSIFSEKKAHCCFEKADLQCDLEQQDLTVTEEWTDEMCHIPQKGALKIPQTWHVLLICTLQLSPSLRSEFLRARVPCGEIHMKCLIYAK